MSNPSAAERESTLRALLNAPLIVGASVSADYGAPSPGRLLAERFGSGDRLRVRAKRGVSAPESLKLVRPGEIEDRTVVIGLDLFFWDSALGKCEASLRSLASLVERTVAARIPLVLGDIPELMPRSQPCRDQLNRALRGAAHAEPDWVKLLKLEDIYLEARHTGGLRVGKQLHSLSELLPDGMHIGPLASNYLADKIAAALE